MGPDPRTSARETQAAGDAPTPPADLSHVQYMLGTAGRSKDYEVLAFLGAGGLGVVYKAYDTRLKRPVAIKMIRGARLLDARAGARLRAEALAAASLDHPYICKMYELIDTEGGPLIVMEFLEGETLARLFRRGRPPLGPAMHIGLEIAEGLAAAHAHGLVHRDVTPGNVMITSNGHVKLLDFGLALEDSLIGSAATTQAGHHVTDPRAGTLHYMAPEQAAGRAVSSRADLFSWGVVLYECLTGRLPFTGKDAQQYVQHLQSDRPASLGRLAPATPADLVRLIDQCLEKSPGARPQSADVIVTALRQILDSFSGTGDGPPTIGAERWKTNRGIAAAVLFGGTCLILTWYALTRTPSAPPTWTSRSFVSTSAEESGSRISPDGLWVSFLSTLGGATELRVRRIDGGEAQRIQVPDGVVLSHVWSPDGRQIACVVKRQGSARLVILPAFFGGTASTSVALEGTPETVRLLRWMGRAILFHVSDKTGRSLWRVDLDRGSVETVSGRWSLEGNPHEFHVSPDGRRVAFTMSISSQEDLWTANLDGSDRVRLTDDAFVERSPVWLGQNAIVYQSNRGGQLDLWGIRPDSRTSWPLTSSPTAETPDDTSGDGRFLSLTQTAEIGHLWRWRGSIPRQLTDDALRDSSPTVARANHRVVFQRTRASGIGGNPIADSQLFVSALGSAGEWAAPRFVTDGFAPLVSPDGARVAYLQMASNGRAGLAVRDLDSAQTTVIAKDARPPGYGVFPTDWIEPQMAWDPSGSALYFIERLDTWVVRKFRVAASVADPPLAQAVPGQLLHGVSVSQDGRRLAFLSGTRLQPTLHLVNLADGSRQSIALSGASSPLLRGWFASGSGVVVVSQRAGHEDMTADLEVLLVTPSGEVRTVGEFDRAFPATFRLDAAREVVYATRIASGVHNVYALSLGAKGLQRVTDNSLPDVTFSGVEPLSDGSWMGVRAERTSDIWLMETADQ